MTTCVRVRYLKFDRWDFSGAWRLELGAFTPPARSFHRQLQFPDATGDSNAAYFFSSFFGSNLIEAELMQ